MADKEKVIKELEEAKEYIRTRSNGSGSKICRLMDACNAAIILLKEQEAKWIEYPECLSYDGAYSDSHIVCSACKHVFNIMDNCTEEFDYCPHCGAKMKGGEAND